MQQLIDLLTNACRIHLNDYIHRYLLVNSYNRWDAAEKAELHIKLCSFYVALVFDLDPDSINIASPEFQSVRSATQICLTDRLDDTIGFPLDQPPDFDVLVPLFFDRFHAIALAALKQYPLSLALESRIVSI